MLKKIGEENPILKTYGFSVWLLDGLGPVIVRKNEKLGCDNPDCEDYTGTSEYEIVVCMEIMECIIDCAIGFKNEKTRDDSFDMVSEETIRFLSTKVVGIVLDSAKRKGDGCE